LALDNQQKVSANNNKLKHLIEKYFVREKAILSNI
jgi:hypothetical protein